MFDDDDNLDELLDAYSSKSDVESALQEKQAGDIKEEETIAEKLKSYPKPQRELDLHNHTADEARREIERFLNNSQEQRIRTVRIIFGKGLHSKHFTPVLPQVTEEKVAELKRRGLVLSFKKEKTRGSMLVYLA